LITPKGGISLDPFAGSCTHGIACKIEGMDFIEIEKELEYVEIGKARIKAWRKYVVMDEQAETQEVLPNQIAIGGF
jgi:DNA modification methylase